MNPFLLPPDERLAHWKEFRRSLMMLDDYQKLTRVAEYWARAPLMNMAYDLTDARHWPPPWEMIYNNAWCRSSVAIGMEATLRLAGIAPERMVLRHIIDRDAHVMALVLVVDFTWCLNYDWGSVIPYPKSARAMQEWHYVGKGYLELGDLAA